MTESTLKASDEAAAAVAKTEDRVTLDSIKNKIASVEIINPKSASTLTLAVVTMENGFTVVGQSACADPANYDKALGDRLAEDDAIRDIWAHEGYLLREKLSKEGK